MTINSKLNPHIHSWMVGDDITALFEAFPSKSLRFVGGCVRNALKNWAVTDIDLATLLTPDAVIETLKSAKIRYVKTGFDHGTITAVIDGKPFEITSLRKDVETDGRRAVVAYSQDWAEDARRRDLTINALYADQNGQVFDPNGTGLDDLEPVKFRFVGDADRRVKEDYLRILRFFRFMAWYGEQGTLDAAALKACRENQKGMKKLSAERVWSELKKLLSAPDPRRAVQIMHTQDILESLMPEASNADGLAEIVSLERRQGLPVDPLLRLMAMSARNPLPIALLCNKLKMSKAETTRLRGWADDATPIDPFAQEREQYIAIYKAGKTVAQDRALIRAAGEDDPIRAARWTGFADRAQSWVLPVFPLSGQDLKLEGVKPGPEMGKTLKALTALWVRSGFTADKPKLLMALKLLKR